MRQKGFSIFYDSAVAREITQMLNNSSKSQQEIAQEIGLSRSNIMTMFKQGRTKLPLRLVVPLSKAVGQDPKVLFDLVLTEYMPELLEALQLVYGFPASVDEEALLQTIRRAKSDKERNRRGMRKNKARSTHDAGSLDLSEEKLCGLYDYVYKEMVR